MNARFHSLATMIAVTGSIAAEAIARGALVLNDLAPYSQNFNFLYNGVVNENNLVDWVNDAPTETIAGSPGWYWQVTPTPTFSQYETRNIANSQVGRLYAMMDVNGDQEDQAMGSLNGSSLLGAAFGVVFQNNSGQAITSIDVSYWGEEWRTPRFADSLQFSYISSPTLISTLVPTFASPPGWTTVAALSYTDITITPAGRQHVSGNDPSYRKYHSATISVFVPDGQFLGLRWYDGYTGNTTGDAALAIDDLVVTFNPTVIPEASPLLLISGATAAAWLARTAWRRLLRRRHVT
jgi:hypothetical protein